MPKYRIKTNSQKTNDIVTDALDVAALNETARHLPKRKPQQKKPTKPQYDPEIIEQLKAVLLDPIQFRYKIIGRKPHHCQDEILRTQAKTKTIAAGRRFGKALDITTPIYTANRGWTTMAEITTEDTVFDEHGQPCKVNWISDIRYNRPCYKITFSDTTEIIADKDHEWTVETKSYRKAISRAKQTAQKPITLTTEQLSQSYLYKRKDKKTENNYSIQTCDRLNLPEQQLPLNPYCLGAWLGDGTANNGQITSADPEIISEIASKGYSIHKIPSNEILYSIKIKNVFWGPEGKSHNNEEKSIATILKDIGCLKNKHIPNIYLSASPQQRLELLQGLMDTDGTISTQGHCEYVTIDKNLADQIYTLITSLGIKAVIYNHPAKINGKIVSRKYRICFTTDLPVFKLPRKANRNSKKHRTEITRRYITKIEPTPSVPVRCIEVSSPSHLYLVTHSFIATHNSVLMSDDLIHYSIINPKSYQFLLAPTYDQTSIVFNECANTLINPILSPLLKKKPIERPHPKILFKNGSIIDFRSTKNPENIRGNKAHRIIIDEAAFVSNDTVSNVVEPMLADYDGELVKISTPYGKNNHFYKTYENGINHVSGFASFHYSSLDNPHISHNYIKRKEEEYGSESIVFKTEYLAEFVDAQNQVFPWSWIQECILEDKTCLVSRGLPYHNYVIGIDLAKHYDYTVFTVLDTTTEPYTVVYFNRFNERQYQTVIAGAIQLQALFNNAQIVVDSTGVGDAVFEALEPYGAIGFTFTASSKKQLVERMQMAIQPNPATKRTGIVFPYIETLIKELQYYEYTINPDTNRIKFNGRPGTHDDTVMSLGLAIWGATNVETGTATLPPDTDWIFC